MQSAGDPGARVVLTRAPPICGRPLSGKRKLQDCRGASSDAAICPASDAALSGRRPVWEFAGLVHLTQSVLEALWKALVFLTPSRRLLRHTLLPLALRPRDRDQITLPRPEPCTGTDGNERDAPKIGIGGHRAAPPLPHHRAYGSVPRRFDRVKRGQERRGGEDRDRRNTGCAAPVGRPDVRTCARNRSASRQQPPRGTLAGHAVVVL